MSEPQAKLELELTIPEGTSDGQVIDVVKELAGRLDELHRALGGHGLKVDRLEIRREEPPPENIKH